MKNPLLLLIAALLFAPAAASANESCPAEWSLLRPWDKGDEGIKTLKPVSIADCSALGGLADDAARKKFWDIRKKLIALPAATGGKEPVTLDQLPAILKTAVKEPDAPQFFTAYERYRIKNILLGKTLCDVAVGSC